MGDQPQRPTTGNSNPFGNVPDLVNRYPWHQLDHPRIFAGAVYLIALVFVAGAYTVKGVSHMDESAFPTHLDWLLIVIPVLYAVTIWLTVDLVAYAIAQIRRAAKS